MFHRYFCVAGINDSFVPGERRFEKVCKLKCSKVEKLEKPIWFLNVKRGHRRQRVDSLDDKLWLKSLHDCFPLRAIHLMFQYLQNFFLQLPPDFVCGRVENHFCEKVFQLVAARLRSVSRMQGTFNLRTQSFHFTYKRLLPSQVYFCVDMVRSFLSILVLDKVETTETTSWIGHDWFWLNWQKPKRKTIWGERI